jgi:anti-sigma factor RsiW
MGCGDVEELLIGLASGTLNEPQHARLREHTDACDVCAAEAATTHAIRTRLEVLSRALDGQTAPFVFEPSVGDEIEHRPRRRQRALIRLGVRALAAAAVIGAVCLLWFFTPTEPKLPVIVQDPARVVPSRPRTTYPRTPRIRLAGHPERRLAAPRAYGIPRLTVRR